MHETVSGNTYKFCLLNHQRLGIGIVAILPIYLINSW